MVDAPRTGAPRTAAPQTEAANADATIRKIVFLKAPIQVVWAHLTEAEKLARWFHPADADLDVGRDYRLLGDDGQALCHGRVTVMEPPRRLAYTFTVGPLNGVMTDVEWTLTPVAGGTRLSLVHSGLPEGEAGYGLILALDAGWDEHLTRLRPLT